MTNLTVSKIVVGEMPKSDFVSPHRITYDQAGKSKIWDMVEAHESVSIIIYNKQRKRLVCVKQFRPGVYFHSIPKADRIQNIDTNKYPSELGETIEFCSGIVDKNKTLKQIAVEEVAEETGYIVQESDLEEVKCFRSAIGICGDITTMFYTEVTDYQKKIEGGGIDDEMIEIVELIKGRRTYKTANTVAGFEFLFGLL